MLRLTTVRPLAFSAMLLFGHGASAQSVNPKVDSLLHVADSLRSPGPGSNPDSALLRLRLAVVLEPSARVHATIGEVFRGVYSARRNQRWAYDSAMVHLNEALRIDPQDIRALFSRGSTQGLADNRAALLADYERVLALDSMHSRVVPLLITEYYDVGRTRDAVVLGERMTVLQPRNFAAQFRRGWVFGYLWEQEKAQQVFNRLANDSTAGVYRAWAHGELAYLARARGDLAGAVSHMEAAVRAVPTDPFSKLGLATMLLNAGDASRARPLIETVLSRDSSATGFGAIPGRLLLGWAARDLGDTTLAGRMFKAVESDIIARAATGNDQRPMLLKVYALQQRLGDAAVLLKLLPVLPRDNLYGGPDDHDSAMSALRGVSEYEKVLATQRRRTNARRLSMNLRPGP